MVLLLVFFCYIVNRTFWQKPACVLMLYNHFTAIFEPRQRRNLCAFLYMMWLIPMLVISSILHCCQLGTRLFDVIMNWMTFHDLCLLLITGVPKGLLDVLIVFFYLLDDWWFREIPHFCFPFNLNIFSDHEYLINLFSYDVYMILSLLASTYNAIWVSEIEFQL